MLANIEMQLPMKGGDEQFSNRFNAHQSERAMAVPVSAARQVAQATRCLWQGAHALHLLNSASGYVGQTFFKPLQHGFTVNLMHRVIPACNAKLLAP